MVRGTRYTAVIIGLKWKRGEKWVFFAFLPVPRVLKRRAARHRHSLFLAILDLNIIRLLMLSCGLSERWPSQVTQIQQFTQRDKLKYRARGTALIMSGYPTFTIEARILSAKTLKNAPPPPRIIPSSYHVPSPHTASQDPGPN